MIFWTIFLQIEYLSAQNSESRGLITELERIYCESRPDQSICNEASGKVCQGGEINFVIIMDFEMCSVLSSEFQNEFIGVCQSACIQAQSQRCQCSGCELCCTNQTTSCRSVRNDLQTFWAIGGWIFAVKFIQAANSGVRKPSGQLWYLNSAVDQCSFDTSTVKLYKKHSLCHLNFWLNWWVF